MWRIIIIIIVLLLLLAVLISSSNGRHVCKGNLIIGLALYPSWDELEAAISTIACSLVATGMDKDPDIVFNIMIDERLVAGQGVDLMTISETRYHYKAIPVRGPMNGTHLMIYRFTELLRMLQDQPVKFCQVITLDLRDSIFQSNPFKTTHLYLQNTSPVNNIPYKHITDDFVLFSREGLTLISDESEAVTFVDSGANTFWFMNQCWGDWMIAERKDALVSPISCAGATLGTHDGILEYLTIMNAIWEMFPKCAVLEEGMSKSQGGLDQGTHNVVVHLFLRNFTVPVFFPRNTENSIIFTMGLVAKHFYQPSHFLHRDKHEKKRYAFNNAAVITFESTGIVPSVVHQYDRDKNILSKIKYEYPTNHGCVMPYRGFRFWLDALMARYLSLLAIW